MLPEGHRLHVVLEGISRGWTAVNIRKFVLPAARLHDLVELGTLTPPAAAFLEASVKAGLNILVAGATQGEPEALATRAVLPRGTPTNCLASGRVRRSSDCLPPRAAKQHHLEGVTPQWTKTPRSTGTW